MTIELLGHIFYGCFQQSLNKNLAMLISFPSNYNKYTIPNYNNKEMRNCVFNCLFEKKMNSVQLSLKRIKHCTSQLFFKHYIWNESLESTQILDLSCLN